MLGRVHTVPAQMPHAQSRGVRVTMLEWCAYQLLSNDLCSSVWDLPNTRSDPLITASEPAWEDSGREHRSAC